MTATKHILFSALAPGQPCFYKCGTVTIRLQARRGINTPAKPTDEALLYIWSENSKHPLIDWTTAIPMRVDYPNSIMVEVNVTDPDESGLVGTTTGDSNDD